MAFITRVLRFRLKDKLAQPMRQLACEANFVWNYCAELSLKVWQRFLSGYDFHPFTKGAGSAALRLHSQTIQDDQIRARRGLEPVANHAAALERLRGRMVR